MNSFVFKQVVLLATLRISVCSSKR